MLDPSSSTLDLWERSSHRRGEIHVIYDTLIFSERLKRELRHSWLADGRQESVAEHCWQMSFMAMLIAPYLVHSVDLFKTLKMVIVHDLVEAAVGDVPVTENSPRKKIKQALEMRAIKRIKKSIGSATGVEIQRLWLEFEKQRSLEAKFAKALDNLEVQIQHNIADIHSWEESEYALLFNKMDKFCVHDPFLQSFCDYVKLEGERKLESHGIETSLYKCKT